MDSYMILNLAAAALQLLVVWAFVRPGGSVSRLAGLLLGVQAGVAVLGGILCTTQIPGFWSDWRYSWRETAALVRLSAPIALIALIGILYQKVSIYMMSTLVGSASTGWFSAALRVIEASKTVHLAVFTALYPAMAQAVKVESPGEASSGRTKPWQGPFQQSWRLLLGGAVAAALAISILAGWITQVLYGAEYAPAAAGLRLLGWILIPFTINTFFSLTRLAEHKEQTVMRVQLAGLVGLIGLNAWLIPRWGAAGACLAFVLAEAAQALLYLSPIQMKQPNGWLRRAANGLARSKNRAEKADLSR